MKKPWTNPQMNLWNKGFLLRKSSIINRKIKFCPIKVNFKVNRHQTSQNVINRLFSTPKWKTIFVTKSQSHLNRIYERAKLDYENKEYSFHSKFDICNYQNWGISTWAHHKYRQNFKNNKEKVQSMLYLIATLVIKSIP